MAEELQAGVCGEKWWINNSSRSGFMASPSSLGLNDFSSFGWPNTDHVLEMKNSKCCYNSDTVNQKPKHNQQAVDSISEGSGSILIDSTIQMMGFGLSTTTSSPISSDFNPALLQEIGLTGSSSKNQNDWNSINSESDISCGFPIRSSTSKLLQGLFDEESQPHQSLCNSNNNHRSILSNCSSNNSNTINPGLFSSNSYMRPSVPKQQNGGLPFSDNTTPFWNHSAAATTAGAGLNDITGALFPPSQSQFLAPTFEDEPNFHTLITNKIKKDEEIQDSGSVVKKSTESDHNQPVMKRPRIETPSPLPTFKVRKEKLGDRITALQQLVSPFGKTDTASVLHEAIDHIKFLHHQVGILSTPYLKNGASNNINPRQESSDDNLQDPECRKQDLKSRGLCLVPISSTFTVGNETTADIWTPRSSFS